MFLSDFLLIGMNYLFSICFEQTIHSLSHNHKYGGQLYHWHKLHHHDYPPHKLQSKVYINSGEGLTENLYFFSILFTDFIIFNVVSYRVFSIFFIQTSCYAFLVNYLHRQYHLEESYLNRYQWYLKCRDYHLLHHKKMNHNMGFLTSRIDKLTGNYLSQ